MTEAPHPAGAAPAVVQMLARGSALLNRKTNAQT
jgi:hypothetical protein